jgi:hypothetical protein
MINQFLIYEITFSNLNFDVTHETALKNNQIIFFTGERKLSYLSESLDLIKIQYTAMEKFKWANFFQHLICIALKLNYATPPLSCLRPIKGLIFLLIIITSLEFFAYGKIF